MRNKVEDHTIAVRVAYADDHKAVRKGIISFLQELGGVEIIIEASNGLELIEQLEHCHKLPDICIIDINMPKMNGFETVAAIRKKWQDQRILILSTYNEDIYILRCIRAGADGYLVKSCDPEEIKEALLSIQNIGYYYPKVYTEKPMDDIKKASGNRLSNFTEREITFLKYTCTDMNYAEIAQCMECTRKSVEGYRDNLFRKLKVNNRVSLAIFAIKTGLVLI